MTIKKQIDSTSNRVSSEHGERNKKLSNSIRDVKDQVFVIRQELKTMREENRATNEHVALMYKKMCEDNSPSSN